MKKTLETVKSNKKFSHRSLRPRRQVLLGKNDRDLRKDEVDYEMVTFES